MTVNESAQFESIESFAKNRIKILSARYLSRTGKTSFLAKVDREDFDYWFFADGKIMTCSFDALDYMGLLLKLDGVEE